MRIITDKIVEREKKKHILFSITFSPENCAVNGIMWKHIVGPDRPQAKIWHMRIAFCIPKAANTLSKYVIITAFPLQQWLHERA